MYNPSPAYRIGLLPLSVLYGAIQRTRAFIYRSGIAKSHRPEGIKIISIGNITVGGTGKTPVTIYLAEALRAKGMDVAILSRGYGRATRGVQVVSEGCGPLLTPKDAGDEPYLMAKRLEGVPLVVAERRIEGAELIKERFHPQLIIMDDGFQHLKIARDVDIVLIDGRQLRANHYVLPAGPLREPSCALRRADIVLLKEGVQPPQGVLAHMAGKPRWSFSYRPSRIRDTGFQIVGGVELIKGKRVFALCAIAEPDSFFRTLKSCGAELKGSLVFADHHNYGMADLHTIETHFRRSGAEWLITTEKDCVKLCRLSGVDGLPLYALSIDVAVEEGFLGVLLERLDMVES